MTMKMLVVLCSLSALSASVDSRQSVLAHDQQAGPAAVVTEYSRRDDLFPGEV
jgi:hypothetical protein